MPGPATATTHARHRTQERTAGLPNETLDRPELSVILPVRNEAGTLAVVLEQLRGQTLPTDRYEVLVVDGMSEDGTGELVEARVREGDNLRLLQNPRYLASAARNIGARNARGDYLLFIDGHCRIPSPDMLAAVLEAFRGGARCISRPQPQLREDVSPFRQAVSLARASWFGHYIGSQIYRDEDGLRDPTSAGCGYTRELFTELGGFDESFDACEDLEFNRRVRRRGVRAVHAREFTVQYLPRGNPRGLFRQLYRYGYGRARLLGKDPRSLSPLTFGLSLFCVATLALPLAALRQPALIILWGLMLALYLATAAVAAVWAVGRESPRLLPLVMVAFTAIHFGAGCGFLSGLLRGPCAAHAPFFKNRNRNPSGLTGG